MEKYVYLLKDGNENVVDVGESNNPKDRLRKKTKCKPRPADKTNFYGRTDITLEVVAGPMPKKEALAMERRLKLHYGLEWTENISSLLSRKLTMDDAREIRAKYIPRKYTLVQLAKEYGVSIPTISYIINNKKYVE